MHSFFPPLMALLSHTGLRSSHVQLSQFCFGNTTYFLRNDSFWLQAHILLSSLAVFTNWQQQSLQQGQKKQGKQTEHICATCRMPSRSMGGRKPMTPLWRHFLSRWSHSVLIHKQLPPTTEPQHFKLAISVIYEIIEQVNWTLLSGSHKPQGGIVAISVIYQWNDAV